MNTVPRPAPGPALWSSTVSTQWLADHLGADNLVVAHAATSRARRLALDFDPATTTVIVFDAGPGICADAFATQLKNLGFERVAVLDGGLAKWMLEDRPGDLAALSMPSSHAGYRDARLA